MSIDRLCDEIIKVPRSLRAINIYTRSFSNADDFINFFLSVDGIEYTQTTSFELDKPFTTQRNGNDEITLCTQTQVSKYLMIFILVLLFYLLLKLPLGKCSSLPISSALQRMAN